MNRRAFPLLVTLVLTACLVSGATAATGGTGNIGKSLSLDQVQALMNTPGGPDGPVVVKKVSKDEALKASKIPGSTTELFGAASEAAAVAAAQQCWSASPSWSWGTWPYDQHVRDNTYWCGVPAQITYRSTHVILSTTVCNSSGAYAFKISGGLGYTFVYIEAGGKFQCPTPIPYVFANRTDWMRDNYTWSGGAWINQVSS